MKLKNLKSFSSFYFLPLVFFLVNSVFAQELQLNSQARLAKLSQSLRGVLPESQDYLELKKAEASNQADIFWSAITKKYQASPEYVNKMNFRLENLFQLRSQSLPTNAKIENEISSKKHSYGDRNSLNALFRSLALENKAWDQLLLGKEYTLYPGLSFFGRFFNDSFNSFDPPTTIGDFGFFAALKKDLPTVNYGAVSTVNEINEEKLIPIRVVFDKDDPRVAGAITTPRFFERYGNTALNKNRRRAAAIFRIYLCDTMLAAVPSTAGLENQIYDLMFPHNETMTENQISEMVANSKTDKHGTQKDCMACHYKLDPLGKSLKLSSLVPSQYSSPGSLVYKRKNSDLVEVKGRGIGDLAKAISQQPEYLQCQVNYFWNWFIGEDIPLTVEKKSELIENFERVGRRTNDFVAYIVNRPEFQVRQSHNVQFMQARQIKQIFQRCQNCHNSNSEAFVPDLTVWPIGSQFSPSSPEYWINKISKVLDLSNYGENRTMPPRSAFSLTKKEIDLLRNWIDKGAPDENGKKMVGP
jgi:hypothetical protein